jgi:hypothetical protein
MIFIKGSSAYFALLQPTGHQMLPPVRQWLEDSRSEVTVRKSLKLTSFFNTSGCDGFIIKNEDFLALILKYRVIWKVGGRE